MRERGWTELDVLLVTGDAYVDHPAFGAALIGRWLERHGWRVGLVAQPAWQDLADVARLGTPRLFAGVTAGSLDSMLSLYTAQLKPRRQDPYSPGARPGRRPARASIVYAKLCRQAFPGTPVVLGGIEASLRRIAHYDYWSDQVRRSVLLDAPADLLVFGMAERAVLELAERLARGEPIDRIREVRGTGFVLGRGQWETLPLTRQVGDGRPVLLPGFEQVAADRRAFARMTRAAALEGNPHHARPLLQPHGEQAVYLNPPAAPLACAELDAVHELPFARAPHFSYDERIPAFETVQHSIVALRGCFGGCTFCSIAEHEGRIVQSRSAPSVLREARALRALPHFRGTISDVGGPTANMYGMGCGAPVLACRCRRLSCLHPAVCRHLVTDHGPLLDLLARLRAEPGLRRVLVASGVRPDLANLSPQYIRRLAHHHTGGQLSVAPEHSERAVLDRMRKPPIEQYERFAERFAAASRAAGKRQYLVPYLIAGHPGAKLGHMVALAQYLKRHAVRPRQVQEFVPTPMSLATAAYHTGLDPMTGVPVPSARTLGEKRLHKALLLYWDPACYALVRRALRTAGRPDLVGSAPHCLVPPARGPGSPPLRRRMGARQAPATRSGNRR
ncbi:MAG: YgiQ family radical SAM protein [Deltaproteobacteria bacterium]|nr:YgiQ family radical SAM protein [Deltaproteobacteria bacterium]